MKKDRRKGGVARPRLVIFNCNFFTRLIQLHLIYTKVESLIRLAMKIAS